MNVTVEKEKEIKSQRARELEELRSKGVAKTLKSKLNDLVASPLTTPEQAQFFLAAMRDKSKRDSCEHKPPTHLTADGIDAWYIMQRKREQELRLRRQEAEELLRGYRGSYDINVTWSPRHGRRSRSSFGGMSEALVDPSSSSAHEKRRQSTMPRLQHNWGDEVVESASMHERILRGNPLGPERTEFLNERQHFDGTQYGKPEDRSYYDSGRALFHEIEGRGGDRADFLNDRRQYDGTRYGRPDDRSYFEQGRALFSDQESRGGEQEQREPSTARFDRSKLLDIRESDDQATLIDTRGSEDRLRDAIEKRGRLSMESGDRDAMPPSASRDDHTSVPETVWRDFISPEPGAKFPPEAGRYHLYASYACPGSHRALIVRALKGLEDVVSVTIVHPTWRHTNLNDPEDKHRGWVFGDPKGEPFRNTTGRGGPFPAAYPGNEPDPILNAYSVRELYESANDTSGKYTIPLLWDKKLNTIVNNESSDISYMLNSCFDDFAKDPELDLYTEDDEEGLDKLNEVSQWLYPMMIHGVYRCGFAKTQKAYDHAIDELTAAFDMADALLQKQRYLTGDILTDADIRLFVTMLRFDEVYAFYFRANTRLVMLTPSLLNFCREIYQMKGVAETCQMEQIKAHFFGSHAEWNKYSVIPRGLGFMKLLEEPHDRDKFSNGTLNGEKE